MTKKLAIGMCYTVCCSCSLDIIRTQKDIDEWQDYLEDLTIFDSPEEVFKFYAPDIVDPYVKSDLEIFKLRLEEWRQ